MDLQERGHCVYVGIGSRGRHPFTAGADPKGNACSIHHTVDMRLSECWRVASANELLYVFVGLAKSSF